MYELRRWQNEAYEKWREYGHRGTIKASTGSGKTAIALQIIEDSPYESILIVVPTIALQQQWFDEIKKHTTIDTSHVGLLGGKDRNVKRITIAVINSVRKRRMKFDILIIDEIHRSGSSVNNLYLKEGFFARIIGLSATPERTDDNMALMLYAPIIYEYKRKQSIEEGVLSKFKVLFKHVNLTSEEARKYNKYQWYVEDNKPKHYPGNYMDLPYGLRQTYSKRRKLLTGAENKISMVKKIVKKNKGQKIIIFTEYINTAEEIHKVVNDSVVYHSKSSDRRIALENFKLGISNILITVKALDEGFDVADASVGIIVAGSKVERQTIQRLGRILRKARGKKAKLYFLYCKNTIEFHDVRGKEKWFAKDADRIMWI